MHYEKGSVRKALEGDYYFSIGDLLKEAWRRTDGVKFTFIASIFVYAVIVVIVSAIFGMIFNIQAFQDVGNEPQAILAQVGIDLLTMPVEVPMLAALMLMGIKHINHHDIKVSELFDYFVYVWPLVFASILIYLFVAIGFMLLILPGIYLSIAYIFVYPLMIDKGMGVWEAMETSRKAVTKHWFSFFGVMLSMVIITIISAIPLGIGLIWTLPMGYLAYGLMYTHVFGFGDEKEITDEETVIEEVIKTDETD
ncbi:MAG: hypothetical protein R3302_06455 [Sulfurimonadaceae bacterium]|nr:hypothetical protein [Sulfurimonadaceae bacterium]